jgi:hypothetical protein
VIWEGAQDDRAMGSTALRHLGGAMMRKMKSDKILSHRLCEAGPISSADGGAFHEAEMRAGPNS